MSELKTPNFRQRPLLTSDQVAGEAIYVAAIRVINELTKNFEDLFKAHGLTNAQYNALRVLRDAGEDGMACQELGAALITRDPDITRLADRLEERSLLTKQRSTRDRRVVRLRLTEAGLKLLAELDGPVAALHAEQSRALTLAQKQELILLLNKLLYPNSNEKPSCPN